MIIIIRLRPRHRHPVYTQLRSLELVHAATAATATRVLQAKRGVRRVFSKWASASGSLALESSSREGVYGHPPSEEGCVAEVVLHLLSVPRSIVSTSTSSLPPPLKADLPLRPTRTTAPPPLPGPIRVSAQAALAGRRDEPAPPTAPMMKPLYYIPIPHPRTPLLLLLLVLVLTLQHRQTRQRSIELRSRSTEVSLDALHLGLPLFAGGSELLVLSSPFLVHGGPLALNGFLPRG
jgi:hypothetical protein